MSTRHRSGHRPGPSLSFGLLAGLLVVLCMVGGAARADVGGQPLARGAAVVAAIAGLLALDRPVQPHGKAPYFLLAAMIALPLLQLIPLPPELWQALPGRAVFAAAVEGAQPWRPIAIQPGAAFNAAGALLVPAAVLMLALTTSRGEWPWLLALVLALAGVSAIVALLQVSGSPIGNPLVNFTPGAISGLFANRNHLALFLAIGCLIAPVWAVQNTDQISWRLPLAGAVMLFFFLLILASGSRAGILTGLLGGGIGLATIRRELRRALRRIPTWGLIMLGTGIVSMIILPIGLIVASDRAASLNRAITVDSSEDMRTRAFGTVAQMIGTYFPVGSGMGGFDPIFRLHEPFGLLKPTYFNHAHNDFVEILLDGGIFAAAILVAALIWLARSSLAVWRAPSSTLSAPGRIGSAMLLLVLVASLFDYPARTPMIMAIVALAAAWLSASVRDVAAERKAFDAAA